MAIEHFIEKHVLLRRAVLPFWESYLQFSPVESLRIDFFKLSEHFKEGPEALAKLIYSKRITFPKHPPEGSIKAFTFEYRHHEH